MNNTKEKYWNSPNKLLRKAIKEGASRGGQLQRYRLLALAFMRERDYMTCEKKTEAKNLDDVGKGSYYRRVAFGVCLTLGNFLGSDAPTQDEVFQWMKCHWETPQVLSEAS